MNVKIKYQKCYFPSCSNNKSNIRENLQNKTLTLFYKVLKKVYSVQNHQIYGLFLSSNDVY